MSIYDYLGEVCNGSMFRLMKKKLELYNSLKNIVLSRHKHYSVRNNQNAKYVSGLLKAVWRKIKRVHSLFFIHDVMAMNMLVLYLLTIVQP